MPNSWHRAQHRRKKSFPRTAVDARSRGEASRPLSGLLRLISDRGGRFTRDGDPIYTQMCAHIGPSAGHWKERI